MNQEELSKADLAKIICDLHYRQRPGFWTWLLEGSESYRLLFRKWRKQQARFRIAARELKNLKST